MIVTNLMLMEQYDVIGWTHWGSFHRETLVDMSKSPGYWDNLGRDSLGFFFSRKNLLGKFLNKVHLGTMGLPN